MAIGCNAIVFGVQLIKLPYVLSYNADFHPITGTDGQLIFYLLHLPQLGELIEHQKQTLLHHIGSAPAFPEVHIPDELRHHGADEQPCERTKLFNIIRLQHKVKGNRLFWIQQVTDSEIRNGRVGLDKGVLVEVK
jgi:hypothetical protein